VILTATEFHILAAQVRSLDATLSSQMQRLQDSRLWVGSDADRYFQEWNSDVHARLASAAQGLEGLALVSAF
jgi:hypothetical protein